MQRLCLFSSPLVTVSDLRCRNVEAPAMPEEEATSHQVVFVRSGMFVKHVGRQRVIAEPAHAVFFNHGETFRVSHPSHGDDCTLITCSASLAVELVELANHRADPAGTPFTSSHVPVLPVTMIHYHILRRALRERHFTALEAEERTIGILTEVVRVAWGGRTVGPVNRRPGTEAYRRRIVEETKLILAANPWAAFSLDGIARSVASSPFHLARIFRAEVGMPVHQYLLRLRLALALERLASGRRNLSELALDLGFASHSHFTTSFRQTFGMSPSVFRRHASTSSIRGFTRQLEIAS
jgi:AraC family transcriptional regulator